MEPPAPGLRSKNVPLGPMPTSKLGKSNVHAAIRKWIEEKSVNPFKDVDLFGDIACSKKFCAWMDGRAPCFLHSHMKGT